MDNSTVLTRKPDIYTAQMNGETVMMDADAGKYYNLGEVGGRIWELLETPITMNDLVEKLTAEYDVSAEQCAKDIVPFIEKMLEAGLLK